MPLIEVLPNSSSVSAPGWAYVPDTGYDPSKAPIQPSARKRNARTAGPGGGDATVKQNNSLLKRLADLDRDNHKDVQISLPARVKEGGGRGNCTGKLNNRHRLMILGSFERENTSYPEDTSRPEDFRKLHCR